MRQPQHFHRQMFQSQKQFSFVLQQQIRFRAAEFYDDIWVLDFRIGRSTFHKLVIDIDINGVQ